MGAARRGLLLDQWRGIQEDQEVYDDHADSSAVKHRRRRLNQAKEQWYGPRLPTGFSVAVHVRAGLPPGHQARLLRRCRRCPPRGGTSETRLRDCVLRKYGDLNFVLPVRHTQDRT